MWKSTWSDGGSPSDFECAFLSSTGQTSSFRDPRDGNTYTIAKLKDGKCWMTQNLEIANKTLTSSYSDVASSFKLPASSKGGFSSYDVARVYVDGTYGGYYTWYAATAGEGTSSKTGDVSHSICPKGWRLPTSSEYQTLVDNYSTALLNAPANFKLGGRCHSNRADSQGSYGFYWSSAANNSDHAVGLLLNSPSSTVRVNSEHKYEGYSVRCVSRQ